MRLPRLAVLACTALLGACNEGPFVEAPIESTVSKPVDTILKTGTLAVCYADDAQFTEAEQLARDTCAAYGLQATLVNNTRYQCRLTTPHRATFRCTHPDLTDAAGRPLNPFDDNQLTAWQQRTGKPLPPGLRRNPEAPRTTSESQTPSPQALGAPPPAAIPAPPPVPDDSPPAAKVPSGKTPGPADVPVWPQPPAPPLPPPAPISAPGTTAPENFTLPVGSWGDSFDSQ